jgi:hypothetical protein
MLNVTSNTWFTANLSQSRYSLASTSSTNKIFFGGGGIPLGYSDVVDIFEIPLPPPSPPTSPLSPPTSPPTILPTASPTIVPTTLPTASPTTPPTSSTSSQTTVVTLPPAASTVPVSSLF